METDGKTGESKQNLLMPVYQPVGILTPEVDIKRPPSSMLHVGNSSKAKISPVAELVSRYNMMSSLSNHDVSNNMNFDLKQAR